MLKSLIYKEWIKVRWILLVMSVLGLVVITSIVFRVRHEILFVEATNYWYSVLFRGYSYFSILKLFPLLAGMGLAVAQYFPETVNKRIKLTFHLPMNENKILLSMHLFGTLCLCALFILLYSLFIAGSGIFFPKEIVFPAIVSSLPWFLGGLNAYFLTALVLLEPVWVYRGLYAAVGYGFVSVFYQKATISGYGEVNAILAMLTVLAVVVVLFSGFRFRKGEM